MEENFSLENVRRALSLVEHSVYHKNPTEMQKTVALSIARRKLRKIGIEKVPAPIAEKIIEILAKEIIEKWAYQKAERIDGLTGLYNKKFLLQDKLPSIITHAARYKEPVACIMIDADAFKQINDTYGHVVGDKVIKHIADSLKLFSRQSDIIARYGGDEFCIICPHTSLNGASMLGKRIKDKILKHPFKDAQENIQIPISISYGVSHIKGIDFEKYKGELSKEDITNITNQLIKTADKNLYENKFQSKHPEQIH